MVDLDAVGIRSYMAEPARGRRDWSEEPEAQAPVYGNRRRIRGRRGRRLMRCRGERIERSFAHVYDTGGMRRTHLRGHTSILKRLLIHAGGFNLGLIMRQLIGLGTPRGLQDRLPAVIATLFGPSGLSPAPPRCDPRVVSSDRGNARLVLRDHDRRQLVSGGDLYHGLAAKLRLKPPRKTCAASTVW